MPLQTQYLPRCIRTLQLALAALRNHDPNDIVYDIYRAGPSSCSTRAANC